jgi:TetR/AcrR family transcriptional repressor of bet genes
MNTPQEGQSKPRKERKANADKRRQQLLDATLRSIATNGLAKTTLATVANEADLSQGVAIFYFKSKRGLLTEALREKYIQYQDNWINALNQAGNDPIDRLIAMIKSDFAPAICNPEELSIWFAFWGEQKFTPEYADVFSNYDERRFDQIRDIIEEIINSSSDATKMASWIETLTDGYWQKLHLFPEAITIEQATALTMEAVENLLPEYANDISQRS